MTEPTVVAFDLSLTSTGVADRAGTFRIRSKKTGEARLVEIRDAVLATCHDHRTLDEQLHCTIYGCPAKPDLVVLEGYSYGSPNQAHPVGELGGVVKTGLYEAGIHYEVVPPAVIKVWATGKGNAKKDDMLLAAVRRLDYQGNSHDEADSLILYSLAMHVLGSPIVTMPVAHHRALASIKWDLASTR